MKYLVCFLLCSYGALSLFAQEQLGLRTENYSGVNGIALNPASNLTTPFRWDVNLGAFGVFVDNNFGSFQNTSIGQLLSTRSEDIFLATDFPADQQFSNDATVFDFAEPGKNKFFSAVTTIQGPSFLLNFDQHAIGLFTNFRAMGGGHRIPAVFGYYDYQSILPNNDYDVFPTIASGMAWGEIGINYLFKKEVASGQIGLGISAKYLQGYESFFIKNDSDLDITKMNRDVLTFNGGAIVRFGFTHSSLDEETVNLQQNGTGFGLDLGITYASEGYLDGYGIKLGAAILDMGRIRFEQNTESHRVNINEVFTFDPRNLSDVTDFRDGLSQLNEELFGNANTTFLGTSYTMGLPTTFSLQADLAIQESFFVNATLLQRLAIPDLLVERGNLLAVTPRFEHRWVSAFLPVSVYNWKHLKVGAALRVAFFVIGTEDLGSFVGQGNLTGTDFYAGIKINPFRVGNGGNRRSKAVKCYEF